MPVAAGDGMGILSQCTYRCVVLPDASEIMYLPAIMLSQCTYRCVVLPDKYPELLMPEPSVSMHLQVRGAP